MPQTLIPQALAAWREGERLLDELPPLSPDHESVALAVAMLRNTVHVLSDRKVVSRSLITSSRSTIDDAARSIAAAKLRHGKE